MWKIQTQHRHDRLVFMYKHTIIHAIKCIVAVLIKARRRLLFFSLSLSQRRSFNRADTDASVTVKHKLTLG